MENPTYLIIKDIFTFIFAAAGLIIAGMGLATWKKQIKGTKEFNIAYNLHYSILKLRNAIKHVRDPFILPSEFYKATQYSKTKYPDKTEEEIKKDLNAYTYEMRWEEIRDADIEMESHLLAAEVLWGPNISNLIEPLHKKVIELNIALKQNFQPPEFRTKKIMEIHDIIYDKGYGDENNDDAFNKDVKQAIQEITDYIKTKIS